MVKPSRRTAIADLGAKKPSKTKERSRVKEETRTNSTENSFDNGIAGVNDWLKVTLDEVLERDQPLWRPVVENFRGSGSGNLCPRALCFEIFGHNVPHDAKLQRIFDVGHYIEAGVVKACRKANVFEADSDQLEGRIPDPLIVCHIDLIVTKPGTESRYLVEVKSINEFQFDKLGHEHGPTLVSKSPIAKSHYKYAAQWNTYAFTPEVNLEEGCILFEAKNTQKRKFYWMKRDVNLFKTTLAVHQEAAAYCFDDDPHLAPVDEERDPKGGNGGCKDCDHRYLCKRLPFTEVAYQDVRDEDAKLRG
jgi:hypothetical protein